MTVVAYNRAYAMSKPVCSDGVTITTIVPSVKNVVVMNARTKHRLVRDVDGNEWYIDKTLQRHILENSTDRCKYVLIYTIQQKLYNMQMNHIVYVSKNHQ